MFTYWKNIYSYGPFLVTNLPESQHYASNYKYIEKSLYITHKIYYARSRTHQRLRNACAEKSRRTGQYTFRGPQDKILLCIYIYVFLAIKFVTFVYVNCMNCVNTSNATKY